MERSRLMINYIISERDTQLPLHVYQAQEICHDFKTEMMVTGVVSLILASYGK